MMKFILATVLLLCASTCSADYTMRTWRFSRQYIPVPPTIVTPAPPVVLPVPPVVVPAIPSRVLAAPPRVFGYPAPYYAPPAIIQKPLPHYYLQRNYYIQGSGGVYMLYSY